MYIRKINAYQVLDSRGVPTVEVEVFTDTISRTASVPSGKSTGSKEAVEIRDNDKHRFHGKGVLKAINNINKIICPAIVESGFLCIDQRSIDSLLISLDNTPNKSKLGSNAILPVSLAIAKLGAAATSQTLFNYLGGCNAHILPIPMFNIINGGAHADNNIDLQEFMIVPIGFTSFSNALRAGAEVYSSLRAILQEKNLKVLVGDEGGFAPQVNSISGVLSLIVNAIERAGYKASTDGKSKSIAIALDCAANEFFVASGAKKGSYFFHKLANSCPTIDKEKFYYSTDKLVKKYQTLIAKFPIISIEDPFHESDWEGFRKLTCLIGDKVQIVGDDIFVTNIKYLKRGIREKSANSILIKLNQIGTLTETIDIISFARSFNFTTIISHRSGETADSFIADLAFAFNTGFIKAGAPCRSERIAKYNQLLRIENMMGSTASFIGKKAFYNFELGN